MIILEAIPWLVSFVMLGAMAALARTAFSSGEFAGRPHIEPPDRALAPTTDADAPVVE
jgi:hypothetical protein